MKQRVLVIEDNVDLLAVLAQVLSRDFEVLTASRGEDGLRLARQQRPALVILDLQLPTMDGVETGRRLKQELGQDTPILVLTALADRGDVILATGCCDAYLAKPAPLPAIEEQVRLLLQGRRKVA